MFFHISFNFQKHQFYKSDLVTLQQPFWQLLPCLFAALHCLLLRFPVSATVNEIIIFIPNTQSSKGD